MYIYNRQEITTTVVNHNFPLLFFTWDISKAARKKNTTLFAGSFSNTATCKSQRRLVLRCTKIDVALHMSSTCKHAHKHTTQYSHTILRGLQHISDQFCVADWLVEAHISSELWSTDWNWDVDLLIMHTSYWRNAYIDCILIHMQILLDKHDTAYIWSIRHIMHGAQVNSCIAIATRGSSCKHVHEVTWHERETYSLTLSLNMCPVASGNTRLQIKTLTHIALEW